MITFSTDISRIDRELVYQFLSEETGRLKGQPPLALDVVLTKSLCFGGYLPGGEQVAFARAITDTITFAYLCDLFVVKDHRGEGISKLLMQAILAHPDLKNVQSIGLATPDAHELYSQFGFVRVDPSERLMIRFNKNS
ncbi:GNAT family N-acetyltransferase [Pseudovibrio brasiliensis]|uniref:GNAT family N-acetyltransferase n=1 Tax=Pseudovibrio brasiliensis TaxID=1898042 RepID=A0ABX8AJS0_9HYPH|nr:GNAT family N-acetyltransferase [Pseudovibrio brasiliensis]QUS54823.1 GNAT family N-acetyltransferase [Pseudovibrio brasiliensis]